MKKNTIVRISLEIVSTLFFLIWGSLTKDENLKTEFLGLSSGIGAAFLVEVVTASIEDWDRIRLFIRCAFSDKPIRVTTAYLLRIEIDGKYLLIKRHKKDRPGYQPVGGAFKFLKNENSSRFHKLGIEPCHFIERDKDAENDLRIIIKRRRNLIRYLKWFESRTDRELDPWREFYEELIADGFLSFKAFPHIQYSFVGKNEEYVSPSPAYPIDELRYAEVYELKFESDEQKNEIRHLLTSDDDRITFATPAEIRNGSTNDGVRILPHTFKILPDETIRR
jgi:hypothetical protein